MILSAFHHPLPPAAPRTILPVFLPFLGCPGRCLYCSQHSQTGTGRHSLEHSLDLLRNALEERLANNRPCLDLGFFGGTFTSLPPVWQERFLELIAPYREKGIVARIRCSTRPDAVEWRQLTRLRSLGLDMVELGVQSFDPQVLALSGRGYTLQCALDACRLVPEAGLELTVQLLPGLPGHGPAQWDEDIAAVCRLGPAGVRIYPCLVLRSTGLAERWEQGRFLPWSIEETVQRLAIGVTRLARYSIPVIRMGLAPEPGMIDDILAGPWHPALGFLVRSHCLHATLHAQIINLSSPPAQLLVPRNHLPEVVGHRGQGRTALNLLGLSKEGIIPWDGDHFLLLARESGDLPLLPTLIQPQHKEGSGCRESGRDAS